MRIINSMERDFAKMSVRLPYMDVAKGILILMVVWSHFALMECLLWSRQ